MPASKSRANRGTAAVRRVGIGAVVGLAAGALFSFVAPWQASVLLGWDAAACTFVTWVWASIWRLDPAATARVATREDPSTRLADSVIIVAGTACLGAVGLVLVKAANSVGGEKALLIAIGVLSVALSWGALHTVFLLQYARLYYTGSAGGIDFNDDADPDYFDFAYMAFTIGLTFQVSDTNVGEKRIRRTVLRHSLLAFLFGAVIVGLTINVVASLLK
jgi:uncharacterized membrane protein